MPFPRRDEQLPPDEAADEARVTYWERLVGAWEPASGESLSIEVAYAALFLASDETSYVNGKAFPVDGGITAAYTTPE